MAAPKKRKVNDDADGQNARAGAKPGRKKTIKRRRMPKRMKVATQPLDNLIMKLPGELRNVIYDLVLIEEYPVLVRAPKGPHRSLPEDQPKTKPWREPGLLKVSKEIRNEASAVYYESNQFAIYLGTGGIEQACTWVKKKHDSCEAEEWLSFWFHFTSGRWRSIMSWMALAKLAYEIDYGSVYDDWARTWWKQRVSGRGNFELKLGEAMLLGVKARRRGLDYKALQMDFEEWARSTISSIKIGGHRHLDDIDS